MYPTEEERYDVTGLHIEVGETGPRGAVYSYKVMRGEEVVREFFNGGAHAEIFIDGVYHALTNLEVTE